MPSKAVERTCALSHKYTGTISRGLKCPYCNNLKLLKGFNDLSTTHPNLALDWSSNNQTAACEVTSVSAYRAEWRCNKCKYTWFTAVRNRAVNNSSCISCEDYYSNKENSFHANREKFEKLWSVKLNGDLPIYLPKTSRNSYWFTCDRANHEYKATVRSTFRTNFTCQVCSGNVFKEGVNDAASLHPELKIKWSPSNNLSLSEINPKTSKKYLWICENNHESSKTVARILSKPNCKYCLKKITTEEDSIVFTHPELAKNWSSENSKKASEISSGSGFVASWNCTNENHSFSRLVHKYINESQNCPICSGYELLKGFNDAETIWPHLKNLLSKNNSNTYLLSETPFKSSRKFYWTCENNHETISSVSQRANFSCGKCISSKGEEDLELFFRSLGIEVLVRDRRTIYPFEIDIYLPERRIAIEFNGDYWHSDAMVTSKSKFDSSEEYHQYKKDLCKDKNIDLYFVWASDWINKREKVELALKQLILCGLTDPILEVLTKG